MQKNKTSKLNIWGRKRNVFIVALTTVIVLLATVGTTVAFLTMRTQSIKNVFEPVKISCEVSDTYAVQNTGTYSAYIRAAVTVNYVKDGTTSTNGAAVFGMPPKASDYEIQFDTTNWVAGTDGFYYYKYPVAVGTATATTLITSFTPVGASKTVSTNDGTYTLRPQMIAEAIQSQPTSTVSTYWNVNISGTTITGKNN